jgi:hypothetical protein
MKKNIFKSLIIALAIFICNFILFAYDNNLKIQDNANKVIVAVLQGYFTGDAEGNIDELILYDDNSFSATFTANSIHAAFSGSFTLDDNNFSFEGYGEALSPEENVDTTTSNFSVFGKGVLDLDKGSGKGDMVINFSGWSETDNCNYYLFLYNNTVN